MTRDFFDKNISPKNLVLFRFHSNSDLYKWKTKKNPYKICSQFFLEFFRYFFSLRIFWNGFWSCHKQNRSKNIFLLKKKIEGALPPAPDAYGLNPPSQLVIANLPISKTTIFKPNIFFGGSFSPHGAVHLDPAYFRLRTLVSLFSV